MQNDDGDYINQDDDRHSQRASQEDAQSDALFAGQDEEAVSDVFVRPIDKHILQAYSFQEPSPHRPRIKVHAAFSVGETNLEAPHADSPTFQPMFWEPDQNAAFNNIDTQEEQCKNTLLPDPLTVSTTGDKKRSHGVIFILFLTPSISIGTPQPIKRKRHEVEEESEPESETAWHSKVIREVSEPADVFSELKPHQVRVGMSSYLFITSHIL